jgi:hypothetical protein
VIASTNLGKGKMRKLNDDGNENYQVKKVKLELKCYEKLKIKAIPFAHHVRTFKIF